MQTGLEPRKLFNVVEFMMHDKDSSGTIDMDECMEILFRRFGKDQLEERTNGEHFFSSPHEQVADLRIPPFFATEFFKHDTDGDNAISFTEFQRQMSSIRPKRRDAAKMATKSSVSMTSTSSFSPNRSNGFRK